MDCDYESASVSCRASSKAAAKESQKNANILDKDNEMAV
jgi:hypothetical protein